MKLVNKFGNNANMFHFALSRKGKICYPFGVNAFDLIVLAILAALTLRGIWKGMVSQIVSVASYFVCWIVAARFGSLIAPTIPVEAPWNQVLAMAIVFIITLVAIRFASAALEKLIKNWHLQKLNTLFGGALGFAKGLLLCMIITFFAVMFSETSRAVVFNSMSGFHLTQLITSMRVFVPKDSYEFVHTQLAQFHDKVNESVPDQPPPILQVQSSETMQQMLAQLQQTKEVAPSRTASLWAALSQWWSGSKEKDTAETVAVIPQLQSTPKNEPNASPAATYAPPPAPQSATPLVHTPATVPLQSSQSSVTAEDFFIQRAEPSVSSANPPLTALSALPPAVSSPTSTALPALAPLSEALAIPEPVQLLPSLPAPHHVGSDMLLRNSALPSKPDTPARLFRVP